jgi:DNA-binding transcriptional MerR regulator
VADLDINQVARESGIPASALRFYEEKGLIKSVGRRGLRRLFDREVIERLSLISLGSAAGFSLEEIARIFAPGARPKIDRAMLSNKADELDAKIQKLTAMRDGLKHAAVCPAPSHLECPKFRRLLGLAKMNAQRARPKDKKQIAV